MAVDSTSQTAADLLAGEPERHVRSSRSKEDGQTVMLYRVPTELQFTDNVLQSNGSRLPATSLSWRAL